MAALAAIKRHTWYLTSEMVPLALWDSDLSMDEKGAMAVEILQGRKTFTHRYGNGYGKPDLSLVDILSKDRLSNYIRSDSLMFFDILGFDATFLSSPVDTWEEDEGYRVAHEVLKSFKVSNEAAEQGVKLVADYLKLAQKEDILQDYLQVVEEHRANCPNMRRGKKRAREDKMAEAQ